MTKSDTSSVGHVDGDMEALGYVLSRRLCDLLRNGESAGLAHCKEVEEPSDEASYISFREHQTLYKQGEPLALDDPCLKERQTGCDIRAVILGGTYGSREDVFTTPVGRLHGVSVHAAIAAQTERKVPHLLEFGLEVALGALFFGPLTHSLWKRYFNQSVGHDNPPFWWSTFFMALVGSAVLGAVLLVLAGYLEEWGAGLVAIALLALTLVMLPTAGPASGQHRAYRWLVLFALLMASLIMLGLLAAVAVYASLGFWLSPVPIAIGMSIEAAVTSSVHTASHLLKDEASSNGKLQRTLVPLSSSAKSAIDAVQPLSFHLSSAAEELSDKVEQLRGTPRAVVEDKLALEPGAAESATDQTNAMKPNAAMEAKLQEVAHSTQQLVACANSLADALASAQESATKLADGLNSSIPPEPSTSLPPSLDNKRTWCKRSFKEVAAELLARPTRLVGAGLVVWTLKDVLFH